MLKKLKKILLNNFSIEILLYLFLFFIFLVISALLKSASADETYYLRETSLISELLTSGYWIGDYGIGLHGFLFKLPVALLFIIIGKPSVFGATFFTIIISLACLLLFYKILKRYLIKDKYLLWATILLSVTLYFINTSLSFNRDIPALFTVLLFLYFFFKNSNSWLIGISLLLMLDAKEHVFLTVAPLYGLYLIINFIFAKKKEHVWNIFKKLFSGYILSLVWLILMFTTSIIPMNMFIASIFGVTETGLIWSKEQFSVTYASQNLMEGDGKELIKISDEFKSCRDEKNEDLLKIDYVKVKDRIFCLAVEKIDIAFAYFGKILYPRTFSFISIPKIIVFPAVVQAFCLFFVWLRKKDKKYILPMILMFNILIMIFRSSHGRYLLCVAPIFIFFFIDFIKNGLKDQRYFRNVLIGTTIFVLLGLVFESTFVLPKIILEILLLSLLWGIWVLRGKKEFLEITKGIFLFALSAGMFFTSIAFSYSIGQISSYIKYGYNGETEVIAKQFDDKDKIWINDYESGDLIHIFRKNFYIKPDWHWKLATWIPKGKLLKTYGENTTFVFEIENMESFKKELLSQKIQNVVLMVSTVKDYPFVFQERLNDFLTQDWLKYERKVELKNKIMYIFKVEN